LIAIELVIVQPSFELTGIVRNMGRWRRFNIKRATRPSWDDEGQRRRSSGRVQPVIDDGHEYVAANHPGRISDRDKRSTKHRSA
jgi:hypothetical protein